MNTNIFSRLVAAGALAGLLAGGAVNAATIGTLDSGGQHITSSNYTMDASIGGIGGVGSGGVQTNIAGFIGQLTEVSGVTLTVPATVNSGSNAQVAAIATLDDNSIIILAGTDVAWGVPAYPVRSISASGLLTATNVTSDTPGVVNGSYLGMMGSAGFTVMHSSNAVDYGFYVYDNLPDTWQVQYFGFNNSNALPNVDVTHTGQNNWFRYVAGLDPTNPAAIFQMHIEAVPGVNTQKRVVFNPRWTDRTYTVYCCTNLATGWWPLTNTNISDNGTQRTVTDLGATDTRKFYRVNITYP